MLRLKLSKIHVCFASFFVVALSTGCDEGVETEGELTDRSLELGVPTYEGRFVERVADDFEAGFSREFFVLAREGESIEVELAPGVEIDRGAVVRAFGEYDDDGVLTIESYETVTPAPSTEREIDPEPRAPRRVAMVGLHWGGGGVPNSTMKEKLFTGETSTNNFYREVSYGREKLVGTVFGPYEVPFPGSCDYPAIALAARKALKDHGHTNAENEYDQFMYFFPSIQDCGWAGLADVGAPDNPARDSWYNGASGCVVLAQELGHNYGMKHSHSYDCQIDGEDVPFSDDCTFAEYGHPYDPMGGGCGHINQVQKGFMGWTGGCNVVTATSDGTFNLMPTELPCDGTQALRFETGDGRYYYLEYRRPIGLFDDPSAQWSEGLSGVLVHVAGEFAGFGGPKNYILDMYDGPGAFMHAGDVHTDYADSVTFEVIAEFDTHAVIDVKFPGGGSGAPTCMDDGEPELQQNGAYGTMECAEGPVAPDISAPTVEITYPEDGDKFEPGATFDLTAEGMDDEGIVSMELWLDSEPIYKLNGPPWEWPIDGIPAGEYQFGVLASDGPNQTPSQPVNITVAKGATDPEPGDTGDTGGDEGGTGGDEDTGDGDAGAGESASEGGCGCNQTDSPAGSALAILGLGFGAWWRRRRR
jgi:MYXO-CTERM domain-containing protein